MNWRKALLTAVLATGLSVSLVPRVAADDDDGRKWRHSKKWDRAHDRWHNRHDWDRSHNRWHRQHDRDRNDNRWRHHSRNDSDWWRYRNRNDSDWWRYRDRDGDWRRWQDRSRYDGYRYGGTYRNDYRHDDRYRKLMERMATDRAKIREIEPTGRHRKALQWYKDDLRNAQRDLERYHADARR